MRRRTFLGLAGGAAMAGSQPAGGWKAGVAAISITPDGPIWLAGLASRNHASEGVRRDIFLKALALEDGAGGRSVLVTADLVDVRRDVWDPVAERCAAQHGLGRDRLAINESHTHSAPVVTSRPGEGIYPLDAAQQETVRRYTATVADRAVEVVGRALADLAPASLAFGQGLAGIAVNRRRVRLRSLPGPVDHDVPVLAVRDPNGKLRAVAAGYACHATALSDYQVSGDWPGFAQEEIEKAHPGAVAMFVQGCGADSNALPRQGVELARRHGETLAAAVGQVLSSKMTAVTGGLRTAFERVDVPFQAGPPRAEIEKLAQDGESQAGRRARRLLRILDRNGKLVDRYPYSVQVWQFGSGLKMIFLAGEVVVDYSLRLKARHGWDNTWVSGYSNDTFAYIPSVRVLREGGYEGGEAMLYEDFPGPFAEPVEEIIVAKVAELAARTGARHAGQ